MIINWTVLLRQYPPNCFIVFDGQINIGQIIQCPHYLRKVLSKAITENGPKSIRNTKNKNCNWVVERGNCGPL